MFMETSHERNERLMSISASLRLCQLASIASVLLLSVGCAVEASDEDATVDDDEAVGEAEQRLGPSDPSYDTTLSNTCSWVLTCGGVTAKMRWGMSGTS